jgi:hypothetical protein
MALSFHLPEGPLINESVKFLGLQESPISDLAAVAPFLSQLFPKLSQLETRHCFAVGAKEYGMKWGDFLERLHFRHLLPLQFPSVFCTLLSIQGFHLGFDKSFPYFAHQPEIAFIQ